MHEKEFKAKEATAAPCRYSQSGVKSFYLDQQGSSISFFWVRYSPIPGAGKPGVLPC